MFDKLIDFIIDFIDQIIPVKVLKEYQQGVLFRFGKFKKILKVGIHLKYHL